MVSMYIFDKCASRGVDQTCTGHMRALMYAGLALVTRKSGL